MSKKWLISMMATAMVFTLGLGAGCFGPTTDSSSSSEEPISSSSTTVTGTITLNAKTAQVDVYDTMQLTATVEGLEGDVEWSSSNEAVATVDQKGLVSALSVGKATITAKVGDVEATCEVTTVMSDVAPVMEVSNTALQLKKGDSLNVTVSTTWKGKELNAEYDWYLEDENKEESEIVSIRVSEDGKTATFTGLAHGSETYCVSTFVNGMALVETITINSVDNDVIIEVSNMTRGEEGYEANISLVEAEGHMTSIKPEVSVYYKGQMQDVELDWTADNEEFAVMAEDGTITGLKPGTTTFQALVTIDGKIALVNVKVTVYAPEFAYEVTEPVEIDLNGGENATLALGDLVNSLQGTLVEAKIGDTAFATASYEAGVVTVDKASIGNVYGKATVTAIFHVMKDGVVASIEKVSIPVATYRSISTAEELNKLAQYVSMNGTTATGDFRVTADIDMQGADLKSIGRWDGSAWTHIWKGTFDGQGHVIKNAVMPNGNGGLFNAIVTGGVVRNIIFINAEVKNETGMVATSNDGEGLVENVFVHGKITTASGGQKWAPSALVVSKNSGIIRNCFAVLTETTTVHHGGMVTGFNKLAGVTENCGAINLSGKTIYLAGLENIEIPAQVENGGATSKAYTSINTYYAEAADDEFNAWVKSILEEYLKPMEEAGVQIIAPKAEVAKNGSTQLSAVTPGYVANWSLKEAVAGVSVDQNGLVSATADAQDGAKVTVVTTGVFGTKCEFTMTIVKETLAVTLDSTEYDASRNTGAPVNVSSVSASTLTLRHVAVAGVMIEGATFDNGVVTIPNAMLVDGEKANDVTISVTDGDKIYEISVPVVKITKVIMNVDDLNWFGAESAKSQNKYYVLGADIEYTGVYTASGAWLYNVLDGRGYVINNFVTSTGLFAHNGEPGNTEAARDTTIIKNLIFTNAKQTVAGKSILMDGGGFTLKNIYISVAGDTVKDTYPLWRDHYGNSFVYGAVVEFLGNSPNASVVGTCHDGRGIVQGVYGINAVTFDRGGGSDKDWAPDYKAVFASWAEFQEDANATQFFTNDFWTISENGIPVPKTLSITIKNTVTGVPAGTDYVVNYPGYASLSINEVEGVTLSGNVISVADNVAGGTKIVVTLTNAITGETSTKELTVLTNTVINAAEVDFDLNNATVSTAKLTEETLENVSITWNGAALADATFENGVLTLSNSLFGKGQNDWGKQMIVVSGQSETGMVTMNVPVLVYKTVTDIKNLDTAGYTVVKKANNGTDMKLVYGYFKLTADMDATGWAGNGTYVSGGGTYQFYGTLDGQNHVISNYTASAGCRGLFFNNMGTVKNLVLKNAAASANSAVIAHWNSGTIENVYVEGKITVAGHKFDSASLIATANNKGSVKNCVVVLTEVTVAATAYQSSLVAYSNNAAAITNNLVINLSGKDVYAVSRIASTSDEAKQLEVATKENFKTLSETNEEYTSWADVANVSADHWAIEYLKAFEQANMAITAERTDVSVGGSLQLNAKNTAIIKTWSLKEAVAGVSVSENGIVSVSADVTPDTTFTVVATGYAGATAEITLTVVKTYEAVAVTLDEVSTDLRKGTTVSVDLTSYNLTETVTLPEGATFVDGVLTLPVGTTLSNWGKFNATAVARTADQEYTFTIPVFAYVSLASQDDFLYMYDYAVKEDLGNGVENQYAYYLLTENVSLNSKFLSAGNPEGTNPTDTCLWISAAGSWSKVFCGVFDGQNKEISWKPAWSGEKGIFKQIGATGVFKNVKFVDTNLYMSAPVTTRNYGLVENVYLELYIQGANSSNNAAAGIAKQNFGTIRNCVIVITGVAETNVSHPNMITISGGANSKVENCIAINLSGFRMVAMQNNTFAAAADAVEAIDTTKNAVFTSWADYVASNTAYDDWAIEYVKAFEVNQMNVSASATEVVVGGAEVTISANSTYLKTLALKEEVAGVTLADGVLTIGESVAAGTVITVVATTNMGGTAEIAVTVIGQPKEEVTLNAETLDFDLNNETVSVKLTDENLTEVSMTLNGAEFTNATFENGVLTLFNSLFGKGKNDWGLQNFVIKGEGEATSYTINLPVLAFKSVTHINNLENIGFKEYVNNKVTYTYGYFKLTEDVDATGWQGNGTYSGGPTYVFRGTLDGQNHVISNYTPNGGCRGMFFSLEGTVKNLVLKNVNANNSSGIIAHWFNGTLENIYVEGKIGAAGTGADSIGLLVSCMNAKSVIKNCVVVLTDVTVAVTSNQGGMVGYLGATPLTMENCVFINLSGKAVHAIARAAKGDTAVTAGLAAGLSETNKEFTNWSGVATLGADHWANAHLQVIEKANLSVSAPAMDVAVGNSMQLNANAYVKAWSLKEAVAGVSVSEDGIISVSADATPNTSFTVVATGYVGTTKEITLNIAAFAKDEVSTSINQQEIDASKTTSVTLSVVGGIEQIEKLYNVKVNGVDVEGATFEGKNVTIPVSVLVDGEAANAVTFTVETATTIYTVSAPIVKITKVLMNVEDLNWFGANSNKSQNKYYVLGADIEYTGVYAAAAGNWKLNVFDGRGHIINNFATSTSFIGAAANDQAPNYLAGTVVKNVVFTNAKSTVAGKAIVVQSGTFTLENIYVSIAADTVADTRGIFADHYGAASVTACIVEWLGTTAPKMATTSHNGRGIFKGVYGINVTAWDSNNGSDWVESNPSYKADVYSLFANWAAFAENTAATAYFTNDFWTVNENGIPTPKTLSFGFAASATDKVGAGTSYRVDHNGFATVSINEVEGISLSNGIITVADSVAAGTKITVTLTNVATGDTATKEIAVQGNTIINAATLDFDLNNATVSSAKLTDENLTDVSMTLNGAEFKNGTFEDGVLTLSNSLFGKGQNDWGLQNFVIKGDGANGMVTINLPVLAYKGISTLKDLDTVGYVVKTGTDGFCSNVYGYFKLTADFDATGWVGNGTYSQVEGKKGSTFNFYGTIDGQFHKVTNFSTSGNRGLVFANYGTIKNLVFTNATVANNTGVVATSNLGTIEKIFVEGKLNGVGANWASASLIAAKHDKGAIRNCVVVLTSAAKASVATENHYQALIAGYALSAGVVENNVAINLSGNTIYMVSRTSSSAVDAGVTATEKADTSKNLQYTSWEAFDTAKDSITIDDWAAEYLAAVRA